MAKKSLKHRRFPQNCNMLKYSLNIGSVLIIIMLASTVKAQEPVLDFKNVDRETYRHFVSNNWDSLIFTGKKALKQHIDYFFLRYRLGMAYYNKSNYMKAGQHLEKSLGFNSSDESSLEYLYFSYLNMNQTSQENALISKFPFRLNEKLKTSKIKLFDYLHFEPGMTFSNNIKKNEQETFNVQKGKGNGDKQEDVLFGQQDLNDDKYFVNLGAKLNLSRKISAYVGYGFLSTAKLKQIQTSDLVITGDTLIPWNGGYFVGNVYDTINQFYSDKYNVNQNDAYANAQFSAGKGFVVTPAFHYLNVHFNTIHSNSQVTDYFLQEIDTVPVKRTIYEIIEKDTSFNNFVTSLSVSRNISLFNLSLNGTWSNLNNKEQFQSGGIVVFYPYGNLNFYTTTSIVSTWQDNINRFIFEQQVGLKIHSKLWVEGFVTLGEMQNYNEENGFIVHNTGDKIKFRAGTDFIIIMSKNIELSFRYRFTAEEGKLIKYKSSSYEETNLNYQNNTLTGGLIWKL